MAGIDSKSFERLYPNLELLKVASASMRLGDTFGRKNDDNLHENIVERIGFEEEEIEALLKELDALEPVQAQLPEVDITNKLGADVNISTINVKGGGELTKDKIMSVKFGDVKVKTLTGSIRRRIKKQIDDLRDDDRGDYRQKVKRVCLIEALFYCGSVEIVIKKSMSFNPNAAFANSGVEFQAGVTASGDHRYVFKQPDVPFAAEFVDGVDFFKG
jgi:hypothetical protein